MSEVRTTKAQLFEELKKARRRIRNAEEALRESEARLRAYFALPLVGIVVTSPEKKWIEVNDRMCSMLGYSREELSSRTWAELTHPEDLAADVEQFNQLLAGQIDRYSMDKRFIRKDGQAVWTNIAVGCARDSGGKVLRIYGLASDINERKQVEEALRTGKQFTESLIASMLDGLSVLDVQGAHLDVNPAFYRMTGFTREELVGVGTPHPYWPPEEYDNIQRAFQQTLQGNFENMELIFRRKNGERFPVIVSPASVKNEQGQVISYFATVIDITERKRAEEARRESEERFRKIFEEGPLGMVLTSPDFKFFDVNPAFCRMLGYTAEEMSLRTFLEVTHPEHRDEDRKNVEKMWRGEIPCYQTEKRYIAKNGDVLWGRLSASLIRGRDEKPRYALAMVEDITDSKITRLELVKSEAKYRGLVETAGSGVANTDLEGRFTYVNQSLGKMLGYDPQELLGQPFVKFLHADDAPEIMRIFLNAASNPTARADLEFRAIHKNGHPIWCYSQPTAVFVQGRIAGFSAIIQNITKRRRAEEALRESEERFRELFESIRSGVAVYEAVDDGGDFVFKNINAAAERIDKIARDDVIGRRVAEVFPGVEAFGLLDVFRRVLKTGTPETLPISQYKDGRISGWRENRVYKLPSGEIVAVYDDVTELKQAEEELKNSQTELRALAAKMETVREEEKANIAREIHDELGQRLTGLIMDLSMLTKKIPDSLKPLKEKTESMAEDVNDLVRIVRRIATDLRPGILDDMGLVAAIEWQVEEFEARTGIQCHFDSKVRPEDFDPGRSIGVFRILQEALTNVARHAQARRISISMDKEAGWIHLKIKDDGRGIARTKIFGPGSLGLAGMRERARHLGGKIEISGSRGKGTTVLLRIPIKESRSPGGKDGHPDRG